MKTPLAITLIQPATTSLGTNTASLWPPIGLASIAACLEGAGHQVQIIDAEVLRLHTDAIIKQILPNVAVVGLSVNSFNYNSALALNKRLRQVFPQAIIVLGGVVASTSPEILLADFPCDLVISGEGEYAMKQLCENIKNQQPLHFNVSGAAYRAEQNVTIIKNPVQRIEDIDQLPFPAYHLLPPFKKYRSRARKLPVAPLLTSRGCAYNCSFCSRSVWTRKVRMHSPERVLAEIDFLVSRYGVRQIDIMDENFALDKPRLIKICQGIIERSYDLAINLNIGIRSENLTEEHFAVMRKAGVFKVAFGIESADERVLTKMNKKLQLENIEKAVALAKKFQMNISVFFIIGMPGEDEAAFKKSLAFAQKLDVNFANFSLAIPFVGTELYAQVAESGKFLIDTQRNIGFGLNGGEVFFETAEANQDEIANRYALAYKTFYSPKNILKQLLKIRSFAEFLWALRAGKELLTGLAKGYIARDNK